MVTVVLVSAVPVIGVGRGGGDVVVSQLTLTFLRSLKSSVTIQFLHQILIYWTPL
jgi:hypothetical protein